MKNIYKVNLWKKKLASVIEAEMLGGRIGFWGWTEIRNIMLGLSFSWHYMEASLAH